MICPNDFTLPTEIMGQIAEQGMSGYLPELTQASVHTAMQIERQKYLQVTFAMGSKTQCKACGSPKHCSLLLYAPLSMARDKLRGDPPGYSSSCMRRTTWG